jgi:hypothetical protein
MAKEEKSKGTKIVYFKLASKRAIWRTPDGKISLNAFPDKDTGKADVGGSVSSEDRRNFGRVMQAIDMGALVQTGKKDIAPQNIVVKEPTSIKETQAKLEMVAKNFLALRIEQALIQINTIDDPRVLTKIIEYESKGANTARRRRPEVLEALKKQLSGLKASSISEYVEDGPDIDANFSSASKTGKVDKTLEESFDK